MKPKLLPLTVVVLTRNEEDTIKRCISSLTRFAEILVLDDSTDVTISIARKIVPNQLHVIRSSLKDFSALRNLALSEATYDWIFFVDADEEVPQELANEVEQAILDNVKTGYFVRRKDHFLGKWLKYGEVGNIKLLKFGRKNAGKWKRRVHEVWDIKGDVGTFKTALLHYPHPTIAEFLSRINRWTTLDAEEFYSLGVRSSFIKIIAYPKAKFVLQYVIGLGFLDGMPGLIMAMMMSFHSFLTRAKLYMLQSKLET